MKIAVVMPGLNSAATLPKVVAKMPKIVDEIIFVNDGSTDESSKVAQSLHLNIVEHSQNRGYGAAQKSGYNKALENNADIVIMLHPDNQHDPEVLTNILNNFTLQNSDAVYASRGYTLGVFPKDAPWWRYWINIFLTKFANIFMGSHVTDWHTGYRGFSANTLKSVPYQNFPDGFEFDTHMTINLIKHGLKITEVSAPAIYDDDSSSISFARSVKYGINFVYNVLKNS
jgi:glycosyltransferase involved in cell wall biosynthesis